MGSKDEQLVHVFLISYPGQGHINPLLRLGMRLASKGLLVTFTTTLSFRQAIHESNGIKPGELCPVGDGFIRFDFIDDEWSPNDSRRQYLHQYLPQLESVIRRRIPQMLRHLSDEGRPVSCLINNPLIPWVLDVADEIGIQSAMLWVQSCACFLTYYYYANDLVPFPNKHEPVIDIEIPTLPLFKWDELPAILHPSTPNPVLDRIILEQYLIFFGFWKGRQQQQKQHRNLLKPFCVLMDSFDELEHDTIQLSSTLCPIKPVGPLFKDPKIPSGSNDFSSVIQLQVDQMETDWDCLSWLDTKPDRSVVYISFGTIVFLKQEQINEIAHGLLSTGVNFLWVMKPPPYPGLAPHVLPDGFHDKVGDKGCVVQYSPQDQVLAHKSVACFVTHCGWNSTMEAVTSGVQVVALPQWGDQVTNAKFLVDVLGVGVRMCRGRHEDRIVPREEVDKCVKEVMVGDKAEEMRRNAAEWKVKAEKAFSQGGSSDKNLEEFVDQVKRKEW